MVEMDDESISHRETSWGNKQHWCLFRAISSLSYHGSQHRDMHIYIVCNRMYTHVCVCICTDILIYIHIHINVNLHTVHTCMHAYMHACIHTYIHAYIHTYQHTYIHIFMYISTDIQHSQWIPIQGSFSRSTFQASRTCARTRAHGGGCGPGGFAFLGPSKDVF